MSDLQDALKQWDSQDLAARTYPETFIATFVEAARLVADLQTIVDEQAEDEGLWVRPFGAPEAYMQQALRRLHAAIEGAAALTSGDPE